MTSKSLEIVNKHIEFFKKCRQAYAHASDIESAKDYDDDIKIFETIKKDLEAYKQLKQDHDKTLINNGELCVKVCKLENEVQELKLEKKILNIMYKDVRDTASFYMSKCEKLEKALDKACERLWDCPVSQELIDDLDCENCKDEYKECWKKFFLKEVLVDDK